MEANVMGRDDETDRDKGQDNELLFISKLIDITSSLHLHFH